MAPTRKCSCYCISCFFFFLVAVIKHIVVICFLRPYHITASFRMKKVSYEILLRLTACLLGRLTAFPPPTTPVLQGEKGTFELQRKYWCKENMSFQNKRARIMSRQMVLRRILSNGDDRQADRLAQTLPLRRPGERPGQFLSLSMSRPPPPPVCLLLYHVFFF